VKRTSTATLQEVANAAGCSLATASRVMNDNQTVGEEARERVARAAIRLGYVPNASARALRSTQTRLVGAVIPTIDHAIYASMINGLQARLGEKRISLILSSSMYDPQLEFQQVRQLIERGVEAVVLVGSRQAPETLDLLARHRLPFVQTYTAKASGTGVAVGFNNESAGRAAGSFLLSLGHRRLAMIAGITQDNDRAKDRVTGFMAELAAHGLDPATIPLREAPYNVGAGAAAMASLLEAQSWPTAVFCASDILAAGAVKHCHVAGIAVPRTISILGFDNLGVAELTTPELTTFEVPAREMGQLAADYLTATPTQRLHMRSTELPIRLAVRGSTGAAA
jgi:LacI family transcriptional regulator